MVSRSREVALILVIAVLALVAAFLFGFVASALADDTSEFGSFSKVLTEQNPAGTRAVWPAAGSSAGAAVTTASRTSEAPTIIDAASADPVARDGAGSVGDPDRLLWPACVGVGTSVAALVVLILLARMLKTDGNAPDPEAIDGMDLR